MNTNYRKLIIVFAVSFIYFSGANIHQSNAAQSWQNALHAVSAKNWSDAQSYAKQSNDPLIKNIVSYTYLQNKSLPANFYMISSFLNSAKNWPNQRALELRAEKNIPSNFSNSKIITRFKYSN